MGDLTAAVHFTGTYFNDGLTDVTMCSHACRKCLAFIGVPLLIKDLSEFVSQWNTHPIRHNNLSDCPSGIPVDMYEMPEEFGKL